MAGGEHRLALMRQENCPRCAGTGQASIAAARCPACEGDGVVRSARGHMVFTRPCRRCGGSGLLSQQGCQACGGLGQVRRSDAIVVPVPAGVADGARLRVASRWQCRDGGRPAGGRVRHRPRRGAPAVPARGRRLAPHRARWRCTKPCLAREWKFRCSTAPRGCGCRRARRPGSASACGAAARRRPAMDGRGDLVAELRIDPATGARRAVEGTAEAIRRNQRARECPGAVRAVLGA